MTSRRYLSDVGRLAAKALSQGATRLSAMRISWDISGRCENGWSTTYFARPSRAKQRRIDGNDVVIIPGETAMPLEVEIITPCRTCGPCMESRARYWRLRAQAETELWPRTWFGTLTLHPDHHYRFLAMARSREGAQGVDFDALGEAERLRLVDALIYTEIKLMLKRVRERFAGRLRFVAVCELHKSGLPHYHLLVHQCGDEPLRWAHLAHQWKIGFSKWKLVASDARGVGAAGYVAKYLSKSSVARVRASQNYGTPEGIASEASVYLEHSDM